MFLKDKNISYKGNPDEQYSIFASNRQNIQGVYLGSTINAIFGAYILDLRNATIEQDIMIKASAILVELLYMFQRGYSTNYYCTNLWWRK